jgi:hypothetical protein
MQNSRKKQGSQANSGRREEGKPIGLAGVSTDGVERGRPKTLCSAAGQKH